MKKKNFMLAALSVLILSGAGCNNNAQKTIAGIKNDSTAPSATVTPIAEEETNTDTMQMVSILHEVDLGKAKMAYALKEYKQLVNCPSDGRPNCSAMPICTDPDVYCVDPNCAQKILCCHEILTKEEFDILITGHETDSVHIPAEKITLAIDHADCKTQKVKFMMRRNIFTGRFTGYVKPVDVNYHRFLSYSSFFSYLLIKTIMETLQPDEIIMFRGLSVDDAGTEHHIVPIAVVKGVAIRYFDLTDSQP